MYNQEFYYDNTMGTMMKKDCPHNDVELHYGPNGGILRGFSGPLHVEKLSKLPGINVFLNNFPHNLEECIVSNCGIPTSIATQILIYPIMDGHPPDNWEEFEICINFLQQQLQDGKQVNVSCIGGHGRTGLVLAILHGLFTGSQTPIDDIRQQYCKRAIESWLQEKFIHKYLGLPEPVEVVKECTKCKKFPQMLKPNGWRDLWCKACNDEWDARPVVPTVIQGQGQQWQPKIIPYNQGATLNPANCKKCWVRTPMKESLWCLTCEYDVMEEDLPAQKPDGWSKNAWKRLLRRITGTAMPPVTKGDSEKSFDEMSETEWQTWLALRFGPDAVEEAPFSEVTESITSFNKEEGE